LNEAYKLYFGEYLIKYTDLNDGEKVSKLYLLGGVSNIDDIENADLSFKTTTSNSSSSSSTNYSLVIGLPIASFVVLVIILVFAFKFFMEK
jgi:hypothetical protein